MPLDHSFQWAILTIICEIRRDNYRLSVMNFLGNLYRFKLIATLNEIPDSVTAIAHNQPQQQFIHIVKDNMFAQYSALFPTVIIYM